MTTKTTTKTTAKTTTKNDRMIEKAPALYKLVEDFLTTGLCDRDRLLRKASRLLAEIDGRD